MDQSRERAGDDSGHMEEQTVLGNRGAFPQGCHTNETACQQGAHGHLLEKNFNPPKTLPRR